MLVCDTFISVIHPPFCLLTCTTSMLITILLPSLFHMGSRFYTSKFFDGLCCFVEVYMSFLVDGWLVCLLPQVGLFLLFWKPKGGNYEEWVMCKAIVMQYRSRCSWQAACIYIKRGGLASYVTIFLTYVYIEHEFNDYTVKSFAILPLTMLIHTNTP